MGTIRNLTSALVIALAGAVMLPGLAHAETAAAKHARLSRILNYNMGMPSSAVTEMSNMIDEVLNYDTHANLLADTTKADGTIGCAADSKTCYIINNSVWTPTDPKSPEYTITFNLGSGKGIQLLKFDGTAYSTTAAVRDVLFYGGQQLNVTTIATATGTITPATTATGLNIDGGSPGNNDNVTYWGGMFGAAGRAFVPGTDLAFKFCVDVKIHDVSGTDLFACGFRSGDTPVALASYTEYCGIGNVSGAITVVDKTTATTDTTGTWADDAEKTICTLVSATGACTYTIDGTAPSTTHAHTLTNGNPVYPFCQLLNDTDIADTTEIVSWTVAYQ